MFPAVAPRRQPPLATRRGAPIASGPTA